ncbi:serine/threonine-protein kinase SMG1-like [Patiria miniata]|uniref:non-specific serine/threonine protein kinase n=1 Tax=Patiria miniata TaxID=46514 RepID=A0A914AM32_PATMI|nr:serine/threonine-protein kinase SMG1-like [Patiria miniata]
MSQRSSSRNLGRLDKRGQGSSGSDNKTAGRSDRGSSAVDGSQNGRPPARTRRRDYEDGRPGKHSQKTDGKQTNSKSNSGRRLFSDNSQLSSLVSRALHDDDRDRRITALRNLKEYILRNDHAKEVQRQADNLLLVLYDAINERINNDIRLEIVFCIASVGTQMGLDLRRFFQWLCGKIQAASSDEIKSLLLLAIVQVLKNDEKQQCKNLIPFIMTNIQTTLENADTPELLVSSVNAIHYICQRNPGSFNDHFKDTVDILVGWYIDTSQKPALIKYCSDTLISFHSYWLADINFSVTLLGQFLEDMEAYSEDLSHCCSGASGASGDGNKADSEEPQTPEVCRSKILALINVFATVVKCLGDGFSPRPGSPITTGYLSEVFKGITKCVHTVQKESRGDGTDETIILAANECLSVLCDSIRSSLVQCQHEMVTFALAQLDIALQVDFPRTPVVLSPLCLLYRVLKYQNTGLPSDTAEKLFGPGSKFKKLRFHNNQEVLALLLKVYQKLLCIKDVPMLEAIYSLLLADLEIAYQTLLAFTGSDTQFQLVPDNPIKGDQQPPTVQEAEVMVVFDLSTLSEIGSTKSSIIVMWALSPSLFELLTKHLSAAHWLIAECFPATHYALLNTLCAHSESNAHFISSSFGLSSTNLGSGSSKTSSYFRTILNLLGTVLPHPAVANDSRRLCLQWFYSILQHLQQGDYKILYVTAPFNLAIQALLPLAHSKELNVCLGACQCLQLVLSCGEPGTDFLLGCLEMCKVKLLSTSEIVKKAYTSLLAMLPADILLRSETSPLTQAKRLGERKQATVTFSEEDPQGLQAFRLARRSHIGRTPMGTFHSQDFRVVMAFILLGETPSDPDWLEKLYHSCQRPDKGSSSHTEIRLPEFIDGNIALQWFWASWEAAQYCVLAKLRTPLGKPQETFRAIEATLLEFGRELKSPAEGNSKSDCKVLSPAYHLHQLRPVLLLQFLEHLEKLMYNAYEGCAIAMPSTPKAVRTFFRTNRATCQDWLRNIRCLAVAAAVNCGQHAVALRHGLIMLNDLIAKNNTTGHLFEDASLRVVTCLIQLRSPHAITGLCGWILEQSGRSLGWMTACLPAADARYEACTTETLLAIKKYLQLDSIPGYPSLPKSASSAELGQRAAKVSEGQPPPTKVLTRNSETVQQAVIQSPRVLEFLLNQVTKSYVAVSNWSSALKWQESLIELRSMVPEALQKHVVLGCDINVIKALSHFDDRDFPAVTNHLDLVPGLSPDPKASDDFLMAPDSIQSPEAVLLRAGLELVRALTCYHTTGCVRAPVSVMSKDMTCLHPELAVVCKMLEHTHEISRSSLALAWQDWPSHPPAKFAMLMQQAGAVMNTIQGYTQDCLIPVSEVLRFEPAQHDISTVGQVSKVTTYQHDLCLENPSCAGMVADLAAHLTKVQLATAHLARKQGNHKHAQHHLLQHLDLLSPAKDDDATQTSSLNLEIHNSSKKSAQPLLTALAALNSGGDTGSSSLEMLRVVRESSKLLQAMGYHLEAWECLSRSSVQHSTGMVSAVSVQDPAAQALNARSLLSLVKWFTADYRNAVPHLKMAVGSGGMTAETLSTLAKNVSVLLETEHAGAGEGLGLGAGDNTDTSRQEVVGSSPAISETDAVCGRLLHLGTMLAPSLSKAWSALASWCYRWGRKAVDVASSEGGVQLTSEEKAEVLTSLSAEITNSETDSILSILSQAHCSATSVQEEDILEHMQSAYHDGTETTRRQLLSACPSLHAADPNVMSNLLEVWNGVCRRIFSHYRLAARSYFTFLKIAGEPSKKLLVSHHIDSTALDSLRDFGETEADSAEAQATHEDGNITATLRLLRLLVKYAGELRDVLEDGLAHTPTGPWKSIIPQLFSRLSHPEAYVRQSISDLLCRVAQDSPHLIVYQAIVGCPSTTAEDKKSKDVVQQGVISKLLKSPNKDVTAEDEDSQEDANLKDADQDSTQEDNPEDEEHNRSLSLLEDCLTAIVATLSKHSPELVGQVEVLVQELRRITVLWEELWLGTLNQLHVDVTRRLHQLEEEVKRVQRNDGLSAAEKKLIIAEKHNAIMKPVVYSLDQVHSITSQAAETPNERAFQEAYQETIEKALNSLKNPETPNKPQSSWTLFKQLHSALQQRATRKATFMLQMRDISPKLSAMENTTIPLPGLVCHHSQVVTISSFDNSVNILPTKTKPKKLVFHGADGKRYTYLFKGLEDLHLDERIMQFLSIVNTMFARNKRQEASLYHACHYSVTPLGPRSGLIQWVDGATALFGLYKRWQQREAIAAAAAKSGNSSTGQPQVPRPSEVYYKKMKPALEEMGLSDQTARKDWPISIMYSVMQELIKDTPSDLLAKELWCSSGSSSEWWHITQAYSRSTAVMSVIGYIIGLGDRHLDNVLVNFLTGDVVHIDYNVCFEKGKNLRVPERVPFRMTQNIQSALGVTGVEGTFRQSAEEVLKIMRKGRETLLTLLEAFVYDPLVDWTTANEGGFASAVYGGGQMNPVVADGGQSKREMERDITRSLFSSRVAEMKGPWFKNRDDMLDALSNLEDQLTTYLDAVQESKLLEGSTDQYTQHTRVLQAALNDKNHTLHTLHTRYGECHQGDTTRTASQQAIQDKLRELDHWHIQHKLALETARGNHLTAISQETDKDLELGPAPYAPCVKFLTTAGQTQIIGQCEHLETELTGLLQQRRIMLRGCVEVLQTYCNMARQFPANFAEMNRAYVWQTWLQELVCDLTSTKCKALQARFKAKYSSPTPARFQQVLATEQALNGLMTEANTKLVKTMEAMPQTDLAQAEGALQQTHSQIHSFVTENGDAGMLTLAAVLMNALCSFSQRSRIMEGAVAGAGDLLVDFASRNGNWFLEELCSMIANLDIIVDLVSGCQWPQGFDAGPILASLECFKLIRLVYEALQDMHGQFRKTVLPQTLAALQSGDASVDGVITELNRMCDGPSLLPRVLQQIEQDLTSVTLGMKGDLISTSVVEVMRTKFNSLLQVSSASDPPSTAQLPPTQGQILLALLSAPFAKVEASIGEFVSKMEQLSVPAQWRKVDVIQEAKSMQSTVLNNNTHQLLRDWAFIKQLEALQEFITLCQQYAKVTNGCLENVSELQAALVSEAQFIKPIKKFMAGLIRKQTIGILSKTIGICTCTLAHQLGLDTLAEINVLDVGANSKASLEDMCKKALDLAVTSGLVQSHLYRVVNNYTKTYDAGWRALAQAQQQVNAVTASQESTQHAQLQLVRFQWLHEDILQEAGVQRQNVPFLPPSRSSVMSDLRKRTQHLLSLEGAITALQERATAQQNSVGQRLKWAAGANPTGLHNVLHEFEKAVRDRAAGYAMENKRSAEVSALSNAILHFEALRTRTSEAINAESSFLALLTRCQESCKKVEQCTASITDMEQDLIDLQPPAPDQPIGRKWIRSLMDLLVQRNEEKESAMDEQEVMVRSGRDALHGQINVVKNTLATHYKLMSEVKTHLKTLARGEEDEAEDGIIISGEGGVVKTFMMEYKSYSEEFTSMLKTLLVGSSEDDNDSILKLSEVIPKMAALADQTKRLCNQLVGLAAPLVPKPVPPDNSQAASEDVEDDLQQMKGSKAGSPVRVSGLLGRAAEGTPATPPTSTKAAFAAQQPKGSPAVMRDPRTGKVIQVRNTHAINVWRRVKGKLDGRDPEPSKRLSIPEQVDFVIKEATSLDNLATLYEGWTAWV